MASTTDRKSIQLHHEKRIQIDSRQWAGVGSEHVYFRRGRDGTQSFAVRLITDLRVLRGTAGWKVKKAASTTAALS
jgi:hypothetical protein